MLEYVSVTNVGSSRFGACSNVDLIRCCNSRLLFGEETGSNNAIGRALSCQPVTRILLGLYGKEW